MKKLRPLYFCNECKKILNSLEQMLFVEDDSIKGFCSENCIEDFYSPIINHFAAFEKISRGNLGLSNEEITIEVDDKVLVEDILASPTESWSLSNELGENVSYILKRFEGFSALIVCLLYKNEASFIFLVIKTKSSNLIDCFRPTSDFPESDFAKSYESEEISEDDLVFIQLLENKKSKLLADLLIQRKDSDIDFEKFPSYENFFEDCLHQPDEVYETKDNEGDVFFNYIKSFNKNQESFFYIISCLKREDFEGSNEVNVYPVLAFPTNDLELYSQFCVGAKISGQLKN